MPGDILSMLDEETKKTVSEAYSIPARYFSDRVKRGLRNPDGTGVVAGVTRVGRVIGYTMDEDGEIIAAPGRLFYRGYEIADIVSAHTRAGTFGYEEVEYLLLMGKLPTARELDRFDETISAARALPYGFFEDVILKSPSRDIMNLLARGILALYAYDPNADDVSLENLLRQSIELIARFPIIVADAYAVKRHRFDGKSLYIHNPKENLSVAENFLRMLHPDKSVDEDDAHLLDIMMMLHAEHGGGNNSAFVCRALSSTGTDTYSAIAGAVSSLKGPLHGGANAKVQGMLRVIRERVTNPLDDGAMTDCLCDILDKKAGDGSGKIYGIGHAVYTQSDPRTQIIKKYAADMAARKGMEEDYAYLESIERNAIPLICERKHLENPICANIDLYSGSVIHMLGIPDELFTPLFAISRISGWCAHRIEEVMSGGRIMRPAYRTAVKSAKYLPTEERSEG